MAQGYRKGDEHLRRSRSGRDLALYILYLQGVPKVIVQRFGLTAWPLVIRSAKFLRECSRKVAHSRNALSSAKSALIFSNERSFFTFFVPLPWLDHIPFELLLFGRLRYKMPEKIRALACLVFEISTVIHLFITHVWCPVIGSGDEIACS